MFSLHQSFSGKCSLLLQFPKSKTFIDSSLRQKVSLLSLWFITIFDVNRTVALIIIIICKNINGGELACFEFVFQNWQREERTRGENYETQSLNRLHTLVCVI